MNGSLPRLICPDSGETASLAAAGYCSPAGRPWKLDWQSSFPREKIIQRSATMWRYAEALPVPFSTGLSLGEGVTPLIPYDLDGCRIWLKCDHHHATGSYKDRGAAVLIRALRVEGITAIKEDSSGNAGAAIAAYAARAGIQARIFAPESASGGKLAQISRAGASLERVPGPRQAATDAALEQFPREYYASHIWNPFFEHGVKTMAFEIVEQLNWRAPNVVVVPCGHGGLLLGLWLGFCEMSQAGIIADPPRLIAAQAKNCAPIHAAWNSRKDISIKSTDAEGIAIANPVRKQEVLEAVDESGGEVIAVSEAEIHTAQSELQGDGFDVEPTSAVAFAGLKKGSFESESIVVPLTGSGLKVGR